MPGDSLNDEQLSEHIGTYTPPAVEAAIEVVMGQQLANDVALIDNRSWPREQS